MGRWVVQYGVHGRLFEDVSRAFGPQGGMGVARATAGLTHLSTPMALAQLAQVQTDKQRQFKLSQFKLSPGRQACCGRMEARSTGHVGGWRPAAEARMTE
jgi:hypothetical protein